MLKQDKVHAPILMVCVKCKKKYTNIVIPRSADFKTVMELSVGVSAVQYPLRVSTASE